LGAAGIYRQLARTLAAAAVMIGAILATKWALMPWLPVSGLARQALLALVPIAAGATAYFLAAGALGVKELGEVASALRRGRRGGAVAR